MAQGYKKITFNDLLNNRWGRVNIFYLLNRILKNRQKYIKRTDMYGTTGISKELFGYSANDYPFEYNLINATNSDLELLMYRFIYKNSESLQILRDSEFKKEFQKKYIFLKTNNDHINNEVIEKIKELNNQRIINESTDEIYCFHKIILFATGTRFIFDYGISYESSNKKYSGFYCGKQLVQKDDELLSDFINRGYQWLVTMLV